MATPRNIPSVSYNSYFGNISKVVWFEVIENYNYFELYYNLTLQQNKQTQIQLYNILQNQIVWQNTYPADVNQEQYLDSVRILFVPTGEEQPFGIINLST